MIMSLMLVLYIYLCINIIFKNLKAWVNRNFTYDDQMFFPLSLLET